jgi:hypothetical protein
MKRIRFTEEQIIGVLGEQEAGAKTADLARRQPTKEFAKFQTGQLQRWTRGGGDLAQNIHVCALDADGKK